MDLAGLRDQLVATGLSPTLAARDPIELIEEWIGVAKDAELYNYDAMAVASVDALGRPSVRNVLMRGVIDDGLSFYTNYESQKGVELIARPTVETLFSWLPLERQIRVRGTVERLTADLSDAYFAKRDRGSQLAAWASRQSSVIASHEWLEQRYVDVVASFAGRSVDRPPHWGGFRVVAERVEFWQGQPNRLHQRLVFERVGGGWSTCVLAP